jgi:hypothetical protein
VSYKLLHNSKDNDYVFWLWFITGAAPYIRLVLSVWSSNFAEHMRTNDQPVGSAVRPSSLKDFGFSLTVVSAILSVLVSGRKYIYGMSVVYRPIDT